jgi:hypothetical protein
VPDYKHSLEDRKTRSPAAMCDTEKSLMFLDIREKAIQGKPLYLWWLSGWKNISSCHL